MRSDRRMFGEVAFEKGLVTSEQIYEALAIQAKAEARSKPYKFLGQILMDLGYLTERQVLEVLSELHATENAAESVR